MGTPQVLRSGGVSSSPKSGHDRKGDRGAGFGVGKGVVVVAQVEPDVSRNGVKLVVGQSGKSTARGAAGAMERIVGVGHGVVEVCLTQASLVERAVMGHQRQAVYPGGDARPHPGESVGSGCVFVGETVDTGVPVAVKIGLRAYELIEFFVYGAVSYDHDPHAAHAERVVVGRFKIYCCKVFHRNRRQKYEFFWSGCWMLFVFALSLHPQTSRESGGVIGRADNSAAGWCR